jgi:peptidoglycan/LPS O-acetylase OafA/YrhL
MEERRIEILDGFRFVSVMSVMLFHYYSRWTTPIYTKSLYPYGSNFNYFSKGNLGVFFFFMISGFVIAFFIGENK